MRMQCSALGSITAILLHRNKWEESVDYEDMQVWPHRTPTEHFRWLHGIGLWLGSAKRMDDRRSEAVRTVSSGKLFWLPPSWVPRDWLCLLHQSHSSAGLPLLPALTIVSGSQQPLLHLSSFRPRGANRSPLLLVLGNFTVSCWLPIFCPQHCTRSYPLALLKHLVGYAVSLLQEPWLLHQLFLLFPSREYFLNLHSPPRLSRGLQLCAFLSSPTQALPLQHSPQLYFFIQGGTIWLISAPCPGS